MFKNYLISAFRNLVKNKWSSLINMFSLAIGIACSILIFIYVAHEFSFDRFHKNSDDIYQAYYQVVTDDGEAYNMTLHPHEFVKEIQQGFPGIKHATTFQHTSALIEHGDKKFIEDFSKVDSTFLSIFSFPLSAGDPKTALLESDKIVISEKLANKFFGDLDNDYSKVVGKVLTIHKWRGKKDYMITGVLKPIPKNSSMQFELLMLSQGNGHYSRSNNPFGEFTVYLQLDKASKKENVELSLASIVPLIYGKPINNLKEKNVLKNSDDAFILKLEAFKDVYFNTNLDTRYVSKSNIIYSYILMGIGFLIITLACINFINLSIGRSLNRTLEIGVRKVLGAGKRQIVFQHSIEKIILIIIALISGYAMSELMLPTFNQLSQKQLAISLNDNLTFPIFLSVVLVLASLIAAGIPALVLSRFSPAGVFRSVTKFGGKGRINSILIVIQFFLSIILLSSVFIMSRQISYMLNKDLGFDKDLVLVIPISTKYSDLYKNKILDYPQIVSATGCDRNFSNGNSSRIFESHNGKPIEVNIIRADEDYVQTLGLKVLEGRNFSKAFPADRIHSVIVNETFLEKFEITNPIGSVPQGYKFNGESPSIIGVVNDYHLNSMRSEIPPLMLHMTKEINGIWSLLVKLNSVNLAETIELLKDQYNAIVPEREFRYTFLDDDWNSKYQAEQRWQKITSASMILAFIISALGLLGMATIITNNRTKEIGIRKVLGASVPSVVAILTKEITRWVIIANLLAWPLTWYAMSKWLENYVYSINIEWWNFLAAGAIALLVALLTVSFQAIRAAIANPVESLRYE